MQPFSVDLWFDTNAKEAVDFYTSTFKNSKILSTAYYGKDMPGPEGEVMYIEFELDGQKFGAVNGGPQFTFSPAISIVVNCDDQAEVDYYWDKMSAVPEAEQCGWIQDKFGVSWQIIPKQLNELMKDADQERSSRAMHAMLGMKKIDVDALQKAAAG